MSKSIYKELQSIIESKMGKTINGTDAMINLGLDSIEFVDLIVKIENHFNVEFPFESLTVESLGDFNAFVTLVENLLDSNG